MSGPVRLLLRSILTIALVAAMDRWLTTFSVVGGLRAYITIGALLTLLNAFVRPFLHLITFPLHILSTLIAVLLVNAVFLYITQQIAEMFDPTVAQMIISGSVRGWFTVAATIGIANWLMKKL
jgi:uncharacterized membrane protein YvlD (DUF360 family)